MRSGRDLHRQAQRRCSRRRRASLRVAALASRRERDLPPDEDPRGLPGPAGRRELVRRAADVRGRPEPRRRAQPSTVYTATGGDCMRSCDAAANVANGDNQRTILIGDTATAGHRRLRRRPAVDACRSTARGRRVASLRAPSTASPGAASPARRRSRRRPATPAAAIADGSALDALDHAAAARRCSRRPTTPTTAPPTSLDRRRPSPRNNSATPTETACAGRDRRADTDDHQGPEDEDREDARRSSSSARRRRTRRFECKLDEQAVRACSLAVHAQAPEEGQAQLRGPRRSARSSVPDAHAGEARTGSVKTRSDRSERIALTARRSRERRPIGAGGRSAARPGSCGGQISAASPAARTTSSLQMTRRAERGRGEPACAAYDVVAGRPAERPSQLPGQRRRRREPARRCCRRRRAASGVPAATSSRPARRSPRRRARRAGTTVVRLPQRLRRVGLDGAALDHCPVAGRARPCRSSAAACLTGRLDPRASIDAADCAARRSRPSTTATTARPTSRSSTPDPRNNATRSGRAPCTPVAARRTSTITEGPKAKTPTARRRTFEFTLARRRDSSFECKLDGTSFEPCTSPRKRQGQSSGKHAFQVRATDPIGQVDAGPAQADWKVKRRSARSASAAAARRRRRRQPA